MIKKVYNELKTKVDKARELANSPLTLSEKILYSHLWNDKLNSPFKRGEDYVDFAPDRIALSRCYCTNGSSYNFMQAGKK